MKFIAKNKFLNNESGNLVVVLGIMGLISGLLVYWLNISSKVDKEIRSLGATQNTSFMRSDFQKTIKKTLQGKNTLCPSSLMTTFESKFKNFLSSSIGASSDPNVAIFETSFTNPTTTPQALCFFNPSRYTGLSWQKLNVSIRRTSVPNYMTLSNFISADILAVFKVNGKYTTLKYQLKYRIDVLTMNHFGLVFINSHSGSLFDIPAGSSVRNNAPTLFDKPSRGSITAFSNMMKLPDTGQLLFTNDVYATGTQFSTDTNLINFLDTKNLYDVFTKGVQTGFFYFEPAVASSFKAPYELGLSEWSEILDHKNDYPIPNSPSNAAITDSGPYYNFSVNHSDTAAAFLSKYASKNSLFETCKKVDNLVSGSYNLYFHNKLTADFTIDFTENTTPNSPPVFCGLIAAKDLIVKLNNQAPTSDFYKNHILGKFILSGKLRVIGAGNLNIHDIMDFSDDQIAYTGTNLDIFNLRTQFYNYKYYIAQNFMLPFFKPGQSPVISSSSLVSTTQLDRFYVPRSSKNFFTQDCGGGKKCRTDISAPSALEDLLNRNWNKLMFEVFDVE